MNVYIFKMGKNYIFKNLTFAYFYACLSTSVFVSQLILLGIVTTHVYTLMYLPLFLSLSL
jgi:hypothetical protein